MNTIYLKSSDKQVVEYVLEQERLYKEFVAKVHEWKDAHEGIEPGVLISPFDLETFVGGVRTEHPELLPGQWKKPNHRNGSLQPFRNNVKGRELISGMHFNAPNWPGLCTQTFYGNRCMVTRAFPFDGEAWAIAGAQAEDGSPRYDDRWHEVLHWQYEKALHDSQEQIA